MTAVHGDAELGKWLAGGHPVMAAATISGTELRVASTGAPLAGDFELGSVSKGITGLLYADARERGELSADTTLGELLPLGDCAAAGLSLAAVSRHASGLPRLPRSPALLRRTGSFWLNGSNPYGEDLGELLVQARAVRLSTPRPRYSNFGYELLGHAVAAAAGLSYGDLVRRRLSDPLALSSMYMPQTPEELRSRAIIGRNRLGRPMQPWTGEALAPAGGIRASIQDMATLAAALLDGSAPGTAALNPVADFAGPAVRIGAAWLTLDVKGRAITWHNGGTGGFRSWMGLDRKANTGAVVLTATSASVDGRGFRLLRTLT